MSHRIPGPRARRLAAAGLLLAAATRCGGSDALPPPELVELRPATREAVAQAVAGALFQGGALHEVRLVTRPTVPPAIPAGTVGDVSFVTASCDSILVINGAPRLSQATFVNGGVVYSGREDAGTVRIEGCPLERWRTEEPEFPTTGEYTLQAALDYVDQGSAARFEVNDILLRRPRIGIDPDKVYIVPEPTNCPCATDGPELRVDRRPINSARQGGSIVCSDFEGPAEECRIESIFVDTRGQVTTATDFLVTGERATGYDVTGRVEGDFGAVELSTIEPLDFECPFECERCFGPESRQNPPGCTETCAEDEDNNVPNNDERPNTGSVALVGANGSTGSITFLDCNTFEVCSDNGVVDDCSIVAY